MKGQEKEINYAMDSFLEEQSEALEESTETTTEGSDSLGESAIEESGTITSEQAQDPTEIEIEGLGRVSIDELKQGYLRQSDYTRKTQEIAKQRKELEQVEQIQKQLQANPHLMNQYKQTLSPMQRNEFERQNNPVLRELEDLKVQLAEKELNDTIHRLKAQYSDFNEVEVLNEAYKRGMDDIEFVYKAMRSENPTDIETLKAELRQEILNELQQTKANTSTIISSTSAIKSDNVKLTSQQSSIAKALGLSEEEYAKWM